MLNLISLPHDIFLSGVWFSLEGAPAWLHQLAARLPLSQIIEAARAVMLEGRDGRRWQALWVQVMVFALGVHLAGRHAVQMGAK